jgi:hypothetical protein
MGGTIITHPGSYLQAINSIRAKWSSPATLKTGVTFFGGFTPGQINRGPGGGGCDRVKLAALGRHSMALPTAV